MSCSRFTRLFKLIAYISLRSVDFLLQITDGLHVSVFATEQLCDFHGGAEFAERVIGQDFEVLDVLNALVHVFVQQRTQNFLCQAGILVEVSTLADIVCPLCLRQRCLVVGNVAD